MSIFVAIQSTYTTYQIGIYSIQSSTCIAFVEHDKRQASRDLVLQLDQLLKENKVELSAVSFIGVNQGPGPFTSQRVIITTVNGIAFAQPIPLVGVDSLKALLQEYKDPTCPVTIALLNAYNKDLYYGIEIEGQLIEEGCKNYKIIFDVLQEKTDQPLRFIGNGVTAFKDTINEKFGSQAIIPNPLPEEATLNEIAKIALEKYNNKETTTELSPIYLKSLSYKPVI